MTSNDIIFLFYALKTKKLLWNVGEYIDTSPLKWELDCYHVK